MLIAPEPNLVVECDRLRKNTIRCDFRFLKRHLIVQELQNFVQHYLQVLPEELEFLQWNGIERCLYLRLCDLETAQRIVALHNLRHKFPAGPTGARIAIELVDVPKDVLLFDLSELVTDEMVQERMEQYGVVLAIGHSRWGVGVTYAGIPSGHRLVRMVVRRDPPRTLFVGDERATVFYRDLHRVNNLLQFRLVSQIVRGWRYMGRVVRVMVQ